MGGSTPVTGGVKTGGSPVAGGSTPATGGAVPATGGGPSAGGAAPATGGVAVTGGAIGSGGAKTGGGTATGGTAATGGTTDPGVQEAPSCSALVTKLKWPAKPSTTKTVTATIKASFDGGTSMIYLDGSGSSLMDCTNGAQGSTTPIIEVPDGGSVKNVVFGPHVGDGIHCTGSCTIDNVWFADICDDAVSSLGTGATVTISNSGFKNARDKTLQFNGASSTVNLDSIYVETAGKVIRSCGVGDGCTGNNRTIKASNIVAIGVNTIVGVNSARGDKATLTNICTYRTPTICQRFTNASTSGSETKDSSDTPDTTACNYKLSETHALLSEVSGSFTSDAICPPQSVKTGTSATACIAGIDSCLKMCAPGGNGFKQIDCVGGKYAENANGCGVSTDPTVVAKLAGTNASSATTKVNNNGSCSAAWAWAQDGSTTGQYCVCVYKAGQYQVSDTNWTVWDCQPQWWK